MIHKRAIIVAFTLFLGLQSHNAHADFISILRDLGSALGYYFNKPLPAPSNQTPPATPAAAQPAPASPAYEPSRQEQQILSSFGSLDQETKNAFLIILNGNNNLPQALAHCVFIKTFNTAFNALQDYGAAVQIAESMRGNAYSRMTQSPYDYNLRPMIGNDLDKAINNKIKEIMDSHNPPFNPDWASNVFSAPAAND